MTDERVYRESAKMGPIDGDLYIEDGRVEATDGKLTVKGAIRCERDCELVGEIEAREIYSPRGDVYVRGSVKVERIELKHGRLNVTGSLESGEIRVSKSMDIGGELKSDNARVGGSLEVTGNVEAGKIKVGGTFHANRDAKVDYVDVGGSYTVLGKVTSRSIDIGGTLRTNEIEAEDIDVGGTFTAEGPATVESIKVGGTVKLSGGKVKRRIDVGGTLKSSEFIDFGDINVGGTVKLEGGGKGQLIDVGGTLSSDEHLSFTRIDVGGTVSLDRGADGEDLTVGGSLKSRGDFTLSNRLKVGGRASVEGTLKVNSVRVGGRIEADKVLAEQFIETSDIRTRYGAKATRIEIERRGTVRGPLIGDIVTLKERAEADDIYADRIQLRGRCSAGNLYGRIIRIDSRCELQSVTYTEELSADGSVIIRGGSQKSEKLPDPPI